MNCKTVLLALSVMFLATACSHEGQDRNQAQASAPASDGNAPSDPRSAHIVCYSGTEVIYVGDSSPEIPPSVGADGVSFRDAKTGHAVHITGACIVTYQT